MAALRLVVVGRGRSDVLGAVVHRQRRGRGREEFHREDGGRVPAFPRRGIPDPDLRQCRVNGSLPRADPDDRRRFAHPPAELHSVDHRRRVLLELRPDLEVTCPEADTARRRGRAGYCNLVGTLTPVRHPVGRSIDDVSRDGDDGRSPPTTDRTRARTTPAAAGSRLGRRGSFFRKGCVVAASSRSSQRTAGYSLHQAALPDSPATALCPPVYAALLRCRRAARPCVRHFPLAAAGSPLGRPWGNETPTRPQRL